MALLFWRKKRKLALIGLIATGSMVMTSRSSGPIMTCFFALLALAVWKFRHRMRLIRWGAVFAIIALSIVMNAPVYYLLARIDLTGSSTSYYRAALINSAISHLDEWWLGGTDYTRHWMPTGAAWSPDQADITNHYIKMGVLGGLPLMLLFISVLIAGFMSVGRALRLKENQPDEQFLIWTLGAILFAHAATMISVSYFDQSIVFLYLVLAAIGSVHAAALAQAELGEEQTGQIEIGTEVTTTATYYG
jgi:multidrug transporter EmrE-like cation transporter